MGDINDHRKSKTYVRSLDSIIITRFSYGDHLPFYILFDSPGSCLSPVHSTESVEGRDMS